MTREHDLPPALAELLSRTREDEGVVGVILTGSQGRPGMATLDPHTEVFLVVTEDAHERWQGVHSADLEIAVFEMGALEHPSLPDGEVDGWWNRYAFAHAEVLVDRTGGRVQELITAQGRLTPDEGLELATSYLDGYLNLAIRSLASFRDGRFLEGRLDAAESLPFVLTVIFALENRVRPHNNFLTWELKHFPLDNQVLGDNLRRLLEDILLTGDTAAQKTLFALLDVSMSAPELREVIDSWGDDVQILRTASPDAA